MANKILLYLKKSDWILFSAVLLLLFFGLAEIYSIALGNDELSLLNFKKQALFILIGLALSLAVSLVDFSNIKSFGLYLYGLAVLMLLAVLLFGTEIRGTTGWFYVFGLGIQPVEAVKVIFLVFLARYLSDYRLEGDFKKLFFSGASALVLIVLVLLQPDFGSAVIIFALWFFMLFVSGLPARYMAVIAVFLAGAMMLGWFFFFADYQRERVIALFKPEENTLTAGYNVNQSVIAVGSGRLIGRGIGFGSQSQLKFLPESQNDFIFAVIAEELGFFGVILVLGFFSLVLFRLLLHARRSKHVYPAYFLCGTAALIFIQMFINIGMNIGLVPVIGISLPFVSYGGSAIISFLILHGLAQNIIINSKIKY